MINESDFILLKRALLKNYVDTSVLIEISGTIQTKLFITNSKITICKNKIIISNEDIDFSIDFVVMKEIVLDDELRIKIIYSDFEIILEI